MSDTRTTEASEEKLPQLGVSPRGWPVCSVEGLRI